MLLVGQERLAAGRGGARAGRAAGLGPGGARLDEESARRALTGAEVHAVYVRGAAGDWALVATASGAFSTQLTTARFQALAARRRTALRVTARPLPAADRFGFAEPFTVVATLLPSRGSARSGPCRRPPARRLRWGLIAAYAVVAGLVIALSVDVVVDALNGSFWGVAVVGGLLALAVASTAHGLTRAAGPPGLLAAVLLLVLLGLPSAGGAITPPLQPTFYAEVSGWPPPGASLGALRNTVYFDRANTAFPLVVLGAGRPGGRAVRRRAAAAAAPSRRSGRPVERLDAELAGRVALGQPVGRPPDPQGVERAARAVAAQHPVASAMPS